MLKITHDENDRMSKGELAKIFKDMFNIDVNDNTVRDECKRIGLQYEREKRYQGERGIFVGVKIKPLPDLPNLSEQFNAFENINSNT